METHDASSTSAAVAWLKGLSLGEPQQLDPYTIYPVCVKEAGPDPHLLLTHQAIGAQVLEILEKGEGEVQELDAFNKGDQPVVILEGDTLVGCKQNRVVARSVILGRGGKVSIPVGCMEQGRWAWTSGHFQSGTMRISPSVRGASTREVLEAKKHRRPRTSVDQSRLWADVVCCLDESSVATPTSDYHALIDERGDEARERSRALERHPGQVGVLVTAGGDFLGLELTGHPETWDELADRTLPALLMDRMWAPEISTRKRGRRPKASTWLRRVQRAQITLTPGLGQGQDIDVENGSLAGSGLWHDDQVVHLAVFANR
ncbi:MAG: hypothetical protein LJF15_05305 [Acidobacteria bacterium]|nr:hypothetical protein [Acidobacteriota bacterium]